MIKMVWHCLFLDTFSLYVIVSWKIIILFKLQKEGTWIINISYLSAWIYFWKTICLISQYLSIQFSMFSCSMMRFNICFLWRLFVAKLNSLLTDKYSCIYLYVNSNVAFLDWVCRHAFQQNTLLLNGKTSTGFPRVAISSVHHNMRNIHCSCIRRQNRSYFLSFTLSNHHDSDQHNPAVHVLRDKISSAHFPANYIYVNKRFYPLISGIYPRKKNTHRRSFRLPHLIGVWVFTKHNSLAWLPFYAFIQSTSAGF
jgi:hypothetical protein